MCSQWLKIKKNLCSELNTEEKNKNNCLSFICDTVVFASESQISRCSCIIQSVTEWVSSEHCPLVLFVVLLNLCRQKLRQKKLSSKLIGRLNGKMADREHILKKSF